MWLHLTKQLSNANLPVRYTCAGTTHKIAAAYLGHPHLVRGQVSECKASILSSQNSMNTGFLDTNLTRTLPQ